MATSLPLRSPSTAGPFIGTPASNGVRTSSRVRSAKSLLVSFEMTHPLVSCLAPLMSHDVEHLHTIVAEWVLRCQTEHERATLRYFGGELGAVQRRIRCRAVPPTEEEVEIALTAVLALMNRRARAEVRPS